MNRYCRGFSLVELSIVLVILGLLVGGVFVGQTLIRASELRSVTAEHSRYTAAINAFRNKYMAWPGDMSNAQSFWGIQDPTPATCAAQASTTTATCNGNGDGNVLYWSGSDEEARAWQHLANAGMIEGSFTGVGAVPASSFAPTMKFGSGNNWYMRTSIAASSGGVSSFAWPALGNMLFVYGETTLVTFRPEDAWNIDSKMDDGKPNGGKVLASKGDATNRCTDRYGQAVAAADANAVYNITWTSPACDMFFSKSF